MGNTFSRSEALRQVNRIEASKTLSATTKKLATEIKNEITNANTAYQSHRKERTALEQALKSLTDANQKLNDAKKTYKRARTKASDAKKIMLRSRKKMIKRMQKSVVDYPNCYPWKLAIG